MDDPPLTMADLISLKSLDIRVLAGSNGLGREVLWAHSCELNDPERWLGPHELLMTVGLGLPETPEEQRAFIANLDETGLCGVVLGDHASLSVLHPQLYEEANKRSFPVLLTGSSTPFAAIGRTVAAAAASAQTIQVLQLSKLYQLSAYAHTDPNRMLSDLETLFSVRLRAFDVLTGLVILEGASSVPMPDSARERSYALPGGSGISLMIIEHAGEEISSFLLIHLLQVVDVALSRILPSIRSRAERSAQMFAAVLEGRPPADVEQILGLGGDSSGYQVVAVSAEDGDRVARASSIKNLPVLCAAGHSSFLILMSAGMQVEVRQFLKELDIQAGASSSYVDLRDIKVAADEALKVFLSAGPHQLWREFEGVAVSLLARSHKEASAVVELVLGDLAKTDPRNSKLRETLFSYLTNDRRATETAASLGIHRQTLVYRMTRISKITGRDIGSSADLAAFWIAFQAWTSYKPIIA